MMDFYKKANFYFIVIPLAAAIWAVLASTVFLNAANDKWGKMQKESEKSDPIIAKILLHDPDRIKLHKEMEEMGKFDYNTVIGSFASRHGIADSVYGLKGTGSKRDRKKGIITEGARMIIDNIDVVKFTKFLSDMLNLWPNLQCEKLTLKKQNTGPDAWEATMDFKYTFKK
ncbi:MAG: hypothetical protein FVQ82_03650 [Planctomycetes bacterium]|nr:hypothetical protein [Planctomycetota bacterium]